MIIYIVVVFPAPLCPRNDVICPSYRFKVRLLTATFPLLYIYKCSSYLNVFITKDIFLLLIFFSFLIGVVSSQ